MLRNGSSRNGTQNLYYVFFCLDFLTRATQIPFFLNEPIANNGYGIILPKTHTQHTHIYQQQLTYSKSIKCVIRIIRYSSVFFFFFRMVRSHFGSFELKLFAQNGNDHAWKITYMLGWITKKNSVSDGRFGHRPTENSSMFRFYCQLFLVPILFGVCQSYSSIFHFSIMHFHSHRFIYPKRQ